MKVLCSLENFVVTNLERVRHGCLLAVVVLAVGLAGTPAQAGFVTATFSNVNPGEVVTITSKFGTESGWAGVYNFTNAYSDIGLSGDLKTFCIDISQNIYSGVTAKFTVDNLSNAPDDAPAAKAPMGQIRADLIGELWNQNYGKIAASKTSAEANSNAAAFQIAIWEIINETAKNDDGTTLKLGIGSGTFTVSGNATTLGTADSWLHALDLTGNGLKTPGLIALTSGTYQDYVVQGPVTPAPSGLVLGITGAFAFLLPIAWRTRNRLFGANAHTPSA